MPSPHHFPDIVSLESIQKAQHVISQLAVRTPQIYSAYFSEIFGSNIFLKAENLQRTGAFKIRGATNKLYSLGEQRTSGVVTGSAGNHGQALALAAQFFGIPCEIFVPKGASLSKISSARHHKAIVREGGDNVESAIMLARARAKETGMTFCHPFDDVEIIAGQGTLGLEIVEDLPGATQIVVPLGGGGLISGIAIAAKSINPSIRVVGVQISSCAPYIHGLMPEGPVPTLADGIAVKKPGSITEPLVRKWVDEIVEVTEDDVADAMMLLLERSKLTTEGGGAVGLSALLSKKIDLPQDSNTVVVLSGGNVDIGLIPNLVRRHETAEGRRLIVLVKLPDRPGSFARLLSLCAETDANLIEVQHIRDGISLHPRETGIQISLEVRGRNHSNEIIRLAAIAGYELLEQTHLLK